MIIIYNKTNGKTIIGLSKDQDINICFQNYSEDFKSNLAKIYVDNIPEDLENYKIIDNKLVNRTNGEIEEIQQYGKILTEEERQLNKLKPSIEEIKKAENTIEILTLLQEVM